MLMACDLALMQSRDQSLLRRIGRKLETQPFTVDQLIAARLDFDPCLARSGGDRQQISICIRDILCAVDSILLSNNTFQHNN